jgi:hypothetical protein
MTETVSAVLVQVPEAERVVSRHRGRLDAAATAGVPDEPFRARRR